MCLSVCMSFACFMAECVTLYVPSRVCVMLLYICVYVSVFIHVCLHMCLYECMCWEGQWECSLDTSAQNCQFSLSALRGISFY